MISAFIEIDWLEHTHFDKKSGRVKILESTKEGDYIELVGSHGTYAGFVTSLFQKINGADTFLVVTLSRYPDEV